MEEDNQNSKSKPYQNSSSFSIIKFIVNMKKSKFYSFTFGLINLILSLSCIIIYIFMTYKPHIIMQYKTFFMFNLVCRIIFLFDFLFDLVIMSIERKFIYIQFFIDFLSIIPFLIMRVICGFEFNLINNTDMISSSFICFRILRINQFSSHFKSDVNRELFNIATSIISLLIISTIELNVFENTQTIGEYWLFVERDCFDSSNCYGSNDHFHTTFFFIMTLFATIGYYSSTISTLGRIFIIVLIVIQVGILPGMIGDLMAQITSKSIYARTSYKQLEKVDFIILSGNISYGSITVLLQEYFHADHGDNEKHALILMPQSPDGDMKRLLQKYQNKLFYFEGDCLKLNDLERCQFRNAKMIMLLCNKQTDDPSEEDSKTIIQAMAIKKFLAQLNDKNKKKGDGKKYIGTNRIMFNDIIQNNENNDDKQEDNLDNRLVIQLLRPESEHHFELSISKNNNKDQILCIDELKLSLLSKSCLCKGLIALISNLITTNNVVEGGNSLEKILEDNPWMNDYTEGKDYEIYKISLDSKRGLSFGQIAQRIYEKNEGIILFGLNIESIKTKNNIVLLAPTDFILPLKDKTINIYGYLLAKDQSNANKVMINLQKDTIRPTKTIVSSNSYSNNNNNNINDDFLNDLDKINLNENYSDDDYVDESDRQGKYLTDKLILAQAYHVTSEPIIKENAIYQTLQNKLVVKNGHIIICGTCQNLIDFIKPLRAKYINKADCPSIVILSKELPEDKVWNAMAYFDEIFLVQGDPMDKKDLIRAGIATASKVVILTPSVSEISSFTSSKIKNEVKEDNSARKLTSEEEDLLDAKTIFKYNLISQIRKGIFCVIELINPKNVSFLNNKNRKNNDEYIFIKAGMDISLTSSFASGEVYYSNMMDNLICQTYYNPNLLSVLKKLIIGESESGIKKKDLRKYLNVPSGNLFLIDIPPLEELEILDETQLKFEIIFNKLLLKKIICIGVYKLHIKEKYSDNTQTNDKLMGTYSSNFSKKKNNTFFIKPSNSNNNNNNNNNNTEEDNFYFVVTAPSPDFILGLKDKLFVITTTYPGGSNLGNINYDERVNKEEGNDEYNIEKRITGRDKAKRKNVFEIKKEIDLEGERKLKKLNETIGNLKNMLKKVQNSINSLNSEAKQKIGGSIRKTIQTIFVENKFPHNINN